MKKDIFDQIEVRDIFSEIESDRVADKIFEDVEKELPTLVRSYVKEQSKKIKTISPKEVSELIEAAIQSIPKPKPQKIIERTEVKVVPAKDTKKYAEVEIIEELKKRIEKLKEELGKRGGDTYVSGTLLPNYTGQDGKVLSVQGNALKWLEPSGQESSEVYTVSNVTARRTLNADDTSLDELADLIGTLIQDLQAIGLIQ